jgi:surface polysaccharide O-acyltransferase-like enzyme
MMERNIAIDVLRIALAFMVIGKHTHFLYEIHPALGYFLSDGLFRMAVPLFITISGFYFAFSLQRDSFQFWLKRYMFIYIFWMLIYSKFWIKTSNVIFFNFIIGIKHLWYMPGLIGAGIIVFFLRKTKDMNLI